MRPPNRYLPLAAYAFIGDCRCSALVSRAGSVDWCCMPRFDVASCFGRLLDADRGGYCSITPTGDAEIARAYLDDTLVLATTFRTGGGEARLIDCFAISDDQGRQPRLLRILEGLRGRVELRVEVVPRFDYGEIAAWVRRRGPLLHTAVGGDDALVICGDLQLDQPDAHSLESVVTVRSGERARLSLVSARPELVDPALPDSMKAEELDGLLDETVEWWRQWTSKMTVDGPDAAGARRSAIVLKALTNQATGAVVAAPTTSLPEELGGTRNWDYRYSWIRDSHFTVRSLAELGCVEEADGFRRFVERSAAGEASALQVMYGPGGQRRLPELTLDLDGYQRSRPVRVGNAAANQAQHDLYGALLDLAWRWHQRGDSPDDEYWRFLVSLVDAACDVWQRPDCGIWEMRGRKRHFVHSKAMCWVAVDRGLRLAHDCMRTAPVTRWRRARGEIRRAIEAKGFDPRSGTFVQAFDRRQMDAALLLLPEIGFVAYDDERMVATVNRVIDELTDDGLVRRYRGPDGVEGDEGVFLACSFWLAECLARQGRLPEARETFDRALSAGNELTLFAEQYDPKTKLLLGNFPQGLTHLSHLAAAIALFQAGGDVVG